MKKICFVQLDIGIYGGAERVAIEVMTALSSEYEMHLISLNCSEGDTAASLCQGIHLHVIDRHPFTRIRNTFETCRPEYRRILREEKFDYVVPIATYTNFLAVVMALGLHQKMIVCDHGALESQLNDRSITFLRRVAAHFSYRIVVLTERSRMAYRRVFGTPEKKLVTIYNWIDPETLRPDQPYAADSHRIISAGRFAPEKKFETIGTIAKRVFAECPDWEWDLYGDGELFPQVKDSLEQAGMVEKVHLCGAVNDLDKRYRQYAFYVLTSDREGLPLVLLEAKANHLPVVSYDIISGPREIIDDGVDGLLVENQNTDKMAEAMLRLMKDADLRRTMASHTYDNLEKFSKAEILDQWRTLFG